MRRWMKGGPDSATADEVLPDFQSTDLAETGEKLQVHLVEMTKTQLETKQTIQAVLSLEKEPVDNTTSHRSQ